MLAAEGVASMFNVGVLRLAGNIRGLVLLSEDVHYSGGCIDQHRLDRTSHVRSRVLFNPRCVDREVARATSTAIVNHDCRGSRACAMEYNTYLKVS